MEPERSRTSGGASQPVAAEMLVTFTRLTSFEGYDGLLRGVELWRAMHAGGRIFQNAAGSEKTFAISKTVDRLDGFLSHNWVVSRLVKFLGLATHFNHGPACLVTLSSCTVLAALQAAGVIQTVLTIPGEAMPVGVICQSLALPIYFLTLFFWRDLMATFGVRAPVVFLDKCCVDQVDMNKKQLGISKLGAFIHTSEQMYVLYSDHYLAKLWTCYEVASFLVLHPKKVMCIIPVYHSATFIILIFLVNLDALIAMVGRHTYGYGVLKPRYIFDFCIFVAGSLVARRWYRARHETVERLKTFSLRDCSCAVESDRAIVYDNICNLMRCSGLADSSLSDDDVLNAFDALARQRLPLAFARELSNKHTLSFTQYLLVGFIASGTLFMDWFGGGLATGTSLRSLAASGGEAFFWCLVGWPLGCMALELLAARLLWLRGPAEVVWMAFLVLVALMLPAMLSIRAIIYLVAAAESSDVALACLYGLPVLWVVVLARLTAEGRRAPAEGPEQPEERLEASSGPPKAPPGPGEGPPAEEVGLERMRTSQAELATDVLCGVTVLSCHV